MSADLPPLHLSSNRHLPVSVTPFIGRIAELDNVLELFKDLTIRLVTILGVGGVGKTRLALELANVSPT